MGKKVNKIHSPSFLLFQPAFCLFPPLRSRAQVICFVPLPMRTNGYEENIAQILSGSPNLNYFGYFSRHIVRTAKIWPNFFKFQSMSILTYPGCQRLFMRGFRFRSSLKKWPALRSRLRPLAEHVSACGRRNEAPRRTREKTSGTQGNPDHLIHPSWVDFCWV